MAQLLRQPCEGRGEFGAVKRVDAIEQLQRGARLVGLQRAKQMYPSVREVRFELWPFSLSLLHAVLTKNTMTLVQHC